MIGSGWVSFVHRVKRNQSRGYEISIVMDMRANVGFSVQGGMLGVLIGGKCD